jgi:hypothetical protein
MMYDDISESGGGAVTAGEGHDRKLQLPKAIALSICYTATTSHRHGPFGSLSDQIIRNRAVADVRFKGRVSSLSYGSLAIFGGPGLLDYQSLRSSPEFPLAFSELFVFFDF